MENVSYRAAYHSREYVRREWGRYFEVVDIVEYGVGHNQDEVLLKYQQPFSVFEVAPTSVMISRFGSSL